MKRRKLLLVVLAFLLIGAVTAVAIPGYRPYIPLTLTVSLTNTTVIRVDIDHAEWMKGTWFDWDPLYAYAFDFWIIMDAS